MTRLPLYVDDGRVSCPRRGDVELDVCLACPDLEALLSEGRSRTAVVCDAVKVPERRRRDTAV